MSDPVTNVEIEDVLSSIRRLVSEDARVAHPDDGALAAPVKPPEALVLTQEHRVAEPEPQPVSITAREIVKSSTRLELERAIAELEAAVGLEDAAEAEVAFSPVEPDQVEQAPAAATEMEDQRASFETSGAVVEPEAFSTTAEEDGLELDELDWEAPIGQAVGGMPPVNATPIEVQASDFEASDGFDAQPERASEATAEPDDGFETNVETADEGEAVADITDAETFVSESTEAEAAEDPVETTEAQAKFAEQPSQDQDRFVDDADPIVTPFLRHRSADPVEMDHSYVPFASDADDEDALTDVGADAYDDADMILDPEPDPVADQVIDEEMLRDMVADIVRQELQGELGERITRNVRKLVRREINRALAGQDFV